jgi:hypothetical protein
MVLRWAAAAFLLTKKSFRKTQRLSGSLDVEKRPWTRTPVSLTRQVRQVA